MSVMNYTHGSNDQLTEHFNVSEFRCKCGKSHEIKHDPALSAGLEHLHATLKCSRIIVVSGYRCAAHDKSFGGSGTGQHTIGTAADVICYDANGEVIPAKIVCCVASEIGFNGIANISRKYASVHIDVRSGSKYYGDEIYGFSSIWNQLGNGGKKWSNFYDYFGVNRDEIIRTYFPERVVDPPVKTSGSGQTGEAPDLTKWTNIKDADIVDLQKILVGKGHRLTCDGIAGPKTYAACIQHKIVLGSAGPLVRWVQARLTSKGYNLGSIDSKAGAKTMAAIASFQKDFGLSVGSLGGTDWYYMIA